MFGSLIAARFSMERSWLEKYVIIVIVWAALGAPLVLAIAVTGLAAAGVQLEPDLMTGILLAGLAPPSGTVMTAATMMNLSPKLALISYVTGTLAAPIVMPLLAALFGAKVEIDSIGLGLRAFAVVGGGWLASLVVWRLRPRWLIPEASAASGISVLGLVGLCLGAMAPVQGAFLRDAVLFGTLFGAALCISVLLCLIGSLAFKTLGAKDALTIGLLSGTRNVGLTVAASGSSLVGTGEVFCAAALVPVFLMPFAVQQTKNLATIGARRAARPATILWFPYHQPHAYIRQSVPRGRSLRVGRSIDADIRLTDDAVSREHAHIRIDDDTVSYQDLGSTNGLFVDGTRVQEGVLAPGATLKIGRCGLMVLVEDQRN